MSKTQMLEMHLLLLFVNENRTKLSVQDRDFNVRKEKSRRVKIMKCYGLRPKQASCAKDQMFDHLGWFLISDQSAPSSHNVAMPSRGRPLCYIGRRET